MVSAWPGGVPEVELAGTFTEEIEDSRAEFNPEVGPPKRRQRTSVATARLSWEQHLTQTQFAALKTFYETTLLNGTLPFTRTHPSTGSTVTMTFLAPPSRRNVMGADIYRVPFSVRVLP